MILTARTLIEKLQKLPAEALDNRVAIGTMGCSAVLATDVTIEHFEPVYGNSIGEIVRDKNCEKVILIA
jgi:hypothetical protein